MWYVFTSFHFYC
jgi:hypothetical protein